MEILRVPGPAEYDFVALERSIVAQIPCRERSSSRREKGYTFGAEAGCPAPAGRPARR